MFLALIVNAGISWYFLWSHAAVQTQIDYFYYEVETNFFNVV
jgi:hypothetical protein